MSADDTLIRMPKLADTLVEGTLGQWLKQVGDAVRQGEPLASIETDKVTTELTSPASGTLLEVMVSEGRTVPVETPIARVGIGSAGLESTPPPRKTTPVAARLLVEHGLTPEQIPGQAVRLKRDDVLAFINRQPEPEPEPEPEPQPKSEPQPLTSMRRAIADHMTRAHQTIPHGQTVMAADLTDLVAWRDSQKVSVANLTFTALFVYALARALPRLVEPPVNVGVAVGLDTGLIVPVLRQADCLNLREVASGIADLATRARAGRLAPAETQGGRMTLTNVGSFGNLTASPIVPLGQLGILGPGLVERRPMPTPSGAIRVGWRCLISLMFDRRELDDLSADRFLRSVLDELAAIPLMGTGGQRRFTP